MSRASSNTSEPQTIGDPSERCRLVLVLTSEQLQKFGSSVPAFISAAAEGGDVASLIFAQNTLEETPFLEIVRPCVKAAQDAGIAAIIAGEARVAGRSGADGIQLGQNQESIADAIERFTPKIMVGAGNVRSRHSALIIGELQPDYVMFGKPGGDTHEEANPKNLDLGEWWAAMIEIPSIVLGGTSITSVVEVAKRGVEFVALSSAIFGPDDGDKDDAIGETVIAERVRQANELLDQHAPRFEDAEG